MRREFEGVGVIFDLDGTLVHTAGDLADAMNFALGKAGRPPVPMEQVRHLVGHGAKAMLREGFGASGAPVEEAALDGHVENFLSHYLAHIADQSRPFPWVVETLDSLAAAGARLGVCTNKREAPARRLLDELGLATRFAAIVGMDTTSAPKPSAIPVHHCLTQLGAQAGVFVGDSDTDIAAASAAGLPCLFAEFGYGPSTRATEAAGRFADYRQIPALIRSVIRPR